MKIFKNIWTKSSNLFKVIVFLLIIYILMNFLPRKEGFNNGPLDLTYKTYTGDNVYDKFYVSVYDQVLHNNNRMLFETKAVTKYNTSKHGKLLDIGSGTGHFINLLKKNINCIGVDNSYFMVKRAKYNYPENVYIQQNILDSMMFIPNQFTHITCLYFTIYYIKDKQLFFENCNKWLVPKGYLFIHLVDKNNFTLDIYEDTFDIQHYKYNMQYVPKNEKISLFKETFKSKNNDNIRKNVHTLYMNSQKQVLSYAKKAKFDLVEVIDMKKCDFKYHYLYVLQKNN